jgi:pilus assembly protein CpaF
MSHAITPAVGSDSVSPTAPAVSEEHRRAKRALVQAVEKSLGAAAPHPKEADRPAAEQHFIQALAASGLGVGDAARDELFTDVMNDLFGLGPIQALLEDPSVTEIMVNRPDRVYAERAGKPTRTTVTFDDDAHVLRIIERILLPLGKRLDPNNPLADARLPDGSRVNAIIPPVAIAGPCLTIRKFSKSRLGLDDLVKFGSVTPAVADFLRACVLGKLNIVVAGGTGSGKTTLLNALSGCIPDHERVVTIEDAAELKLHQDHVITLEAKRPNADGTGEVSIRDLVRNALRMRPERIVVGECRGGEALDMLQAMNTGHDGSLTTLHANSPRDAISRIETMALMAGIDFPIRAIREQIGSAIQVIVQQARLRDGSRKITNVTELAGMEGDKIVLQELFKFKEAPGPTTADKVVGSLQASGLRPQFMAKLEPTGVRLPPSTFTPGAPQAPRAAA